MPHRDPDLDFMLKQAGMSQRELARQLGYHPNTVNRWKRAPQTVLAYLHLYACAVRTLEESLERIRGKP